MCFANKERVLFARMSRVKSRTLAEVCGDCGASDPAWASINRGILLCSDCCSVHRSLGRHISQVKSLRQGVWCPSVLNLVNSLNAHGANSVWEHYLLDPSGGKSMRRKPTSKDPLHPTKSDFIREKHVNLAFVLKPNVLEDGAPSAETELSKQLHASVRTSNLETSLRLLVQGADPNFFHEEKQSTPLHVAAKFGQSSQMELLLVYGADINVADGNGNTPVEVARANNHNLIGDRLVEAMYEVTDRITMFLGGKKPDHAAGKHMVIPEQHHSSDVDEQLRIARGKLQLVPNKMFEELVMDLYDEVDRRENEAIWATTTLNRDIVAVPFLPTNPYLSATRNQGRQKLARFSPLEFAGLLTDVLMDAKRRQNMANLRPLDSPTFANMPQQQQLQHELNLSDDEPLYDAVASDDDYAALAPIGQQPVVNQSPVNRTSNAEVETLRNQLKVYMSEITQLKSVVKQLSTENSALKSQYVESPKNSSLYTVPLRIDLNGTESETEPVSDGHSSSNQSLAKRPVSMYEPRLGPYSSKPTEFRTTTSMYQMAAENNKSVELQPFSDEVKHRTDLVTRRLKEICQALQDVTTDKGVFVPCAERLRIAVAELITIFPTTSNDTVKSAIQLLNEYTNRIQQDSDHLQKSLIAVDDPAANHYMQEVRNCALQIASATKTLVVQFQ